MKTIKVAIFSLLAMCFVGGAAQAIVIEETGNTAGNPAQPTFKVTISQADVGQSFNADFFVPTADSGASMDLSASAVFNITQFTSSNLSVKITVNNTTTLGGGLTNAGITAIGFGVDPNVTATLSTAGTVFTGASAGMGAPQNFPGGFSGIDACIFTSSPCAGGGQVTALAAGAMDMFTVDLTPLSGSFGQTVMFTAFPIKFQTSQGSFEVPGCIGGDCSTQIPEPAPLGLLVGGLAGLAILRRRRNS